MAPRTREPDGRQEDSTRVRFARDFPARLERLVGALAAARERDDGTAHGRSLGQGDEFVGHRPYRPGEDLRDLDWELYARLERPFVRVRRRAAGERWCVLLDASASMGLGVPGKLQLAAEVATGLAFIGLRAGALTTLIASGGAACVLRKRADLGAWMAFLESRAAAGSQGVRELAGDHRVDACTRLFALGDLFDCEPGDLLPRASRGRSVSGVRLLALHELAPREREGVEWVDPESGERLDLRVGAGALDAYARALRSRLELWASSFARRGQSCSCWPSDTPFEDVVRAVVS